jgi:DNA-binding XRE family transcriptional regulator
MRRSALKHPLAVLRKIIGYDQDHMAGMLGCSLSTVKSVEVNRLKMSPKLAQKAQEKMGISAAWLLAGKADDLPLSAFGETYHVGIFQAMREDGLDSLTRRMKQALKNSSARSAEAAILELTAIYKGVTPLSDRNLLFSEVSEFLGYLIRRYRLESVHSGKRGLNVGTKFRRSISSLLNQEFGAKPAVQTRVPKEKRRRIEALADEFLNSNKAD